MALQRKRPQPPAPEAPQSGVAVISEGEAVRASQDLQRQRVRATKTHRVSGAKLSVDRKRAQPAYQAILHTSRQPGDSAVSHRMAVGVAGAMAHKVLADLDLLEEEGKGGVFAQGTLDRQQVAIKREEDRLQGLESGLREVRDLSRRVTSKATLAEVNTFLNQVSQVLAKQDVLTPGAALLESAIIQAGQRSARDFSGTPDAERLLKARFFSVQKDALKVEGRGEALTPPQIFGLTWEEDGEVRVAGFEVPGGFFAGRKDTGVAAAGKEPEVILSALVARVADPQGGPHGYEQVILESQSFSSFFAEHGLKVQAKGSAISGDTLAALEAEGFKPVTSSVRTGDFLPKDVQERLIPGRLIFDGVLSAAHEVELLDEISMMVSDRVKSSVDAALKAPALQARMRSDAEKQAPGDAARQAEIVSRTEIQEKEMHQARADMALGASIPRALMALKEYVEARQQFGRTVVPDPFQVELGRDLTRLLSEAGLTNRQDYSSRSAKKADPLLFQRLDQLINKAHERHGKDDHIRVVSNPIGRHPLVMIEAMKELKNTLAYYAREERVPGWSASEASFRAVMAKPVRVHGLSDEKLDQVLGDEAQRELANSYLRSVRGLLDKGAAMNRAVASVMADGLTEAVLVSGSFSDQMAHLRARLQVRLGAVEDRYQDRYADVKIGGEAELIKGDPKPTHIQEMDKFFDGFLAVDGDGRWMNSTLRQITEDPTSIKWELASASEALAQEAASGRITPDTRGRAVRATRMARAREAFKAVDMLLGALEDYHFRPGDALRLPKAMGAITRDSREDALKATMPYTASTPVHEEGRVYVAPVKDIGQGEAYMVIELDRDLSGAYVPTAKNEIATGQLARLLDDCNQRDVRVEVLRHGVDRDIEFVDLLKRFSVYPIGGNKFLVNMQVGDSGRVAEALGIDFRGSYWPEARIDRQKQGFVLNASEQGGELVLPSGVLTLAPGVLLRGPCTYLRIREDEGRQARHVYLPIALRPEDLGPNQVAFAKWMDQRAETRGLNASLHEMYQRFKVVAQSHYAGLNQAHLDQRLGGYAALAPKFQAGTFQPDMFGMTYFTVSERKRGERTSAYEDAGAIKALESLIHLRSRLGAQIDLHAIQA